MHKTLAPRLIPALLAVAFAGGAHASGFALQNQNGSGTGYAYAGAAAVAEDASTIYFNPAGLAYLPMGHNFSVAATAIQRSVEFSDRGTKPYTIPVRNPQNGQVLGFGSAPLGNDGGDGGGVAVIPALYWAYAITPDLRVGLGISAPYGSKTDYNSNFIGRFSGRYTSVETLNIDPSIAYRFNDVITLGFGLNYAKTEIELHQAIPTGAVPVGPGKFSLNTAEARFSGDDSVWGWNIGAMINVTPSTRLGIAYRSTLDNDLEGKAKFTNGAPSYNIKAGLELPDNFSLALNQKIGQDLEILADATWTGWNKIQTLTPTNTVKQPPASVVFNYDNTWRFGLGAKYQLNPQWNLRTGIAYDQTPVPNAQSRTMTVPDSDRIWLAFGARWQFMKQASLDFAYAHIFFDDAPVNRPVTVPGTTYVAQTVNGKFDVSANIFSVQLNYNFQ